MFICFIYTHIFISINALITETSVLLNFTHFCGGQSVNIICLKRGKLHVQYACGLNNTMFAAKTN